MIDIKDHQVIDIFSVQLLNFSMTLLKKVIIFNFLFKLTILLELACSKTLKPVPYEMDIDTDITFGLVR